MSDTFQHVGDVAQRIVGQMTPVEDEPTHRLPAPVERPTTMLDMVWRAASDPAINVDKLKAFLDVSVDYEKREAEKEFNQALARLPALRVKKNGRVDLGTGKGSYPFAKWEDIDLIIRPVLAHEGFTLSFDSQARQGDGGGLVVTGTLLHKDGHSRSASLPLALDTGPGRNNLQAMGSTLSYGKRYCAEMLLNIVREGDDDDGTANSLPITAEQVKRLSDLIMETQSDLNGFLAYAQVQSLADIRQPKYAEAENALLAKKKKREAK